MNTKIELHDGKTLLAEWNQHLGHLPAIGEEVRISDLAGVAPAGYGGDATVSMIRQDHRTGGITVILEAAQQTPSARKNVVILNANYVPDKHRAEVEKVLRDRLPLPVFEWQASHEGRPVVEIHGTPGNDPRALARANEAVHEVLERYSPLTTV